MKTHRTTEEEMEGPVSFWGYKEQESNLILPEHDVDDDDDDDDNVRDTATFGAVHNRRVHRSWNVMAHGDAREGKWRVNWRMEWVASTLHTTSENGVFLIKPFQCFMSLQSSHSD